MHLYNRYIEEREGTECHLMKMELSSTKLIIQNNLNMNKLYLIFLFLSMIFHPAIAQETHDNESNEDEYMTYFFADFSNGIDAEFKMYDLDQQILHFSMVQAGFTQGDAFTALREKRVSHPNLYAASTSKYKYAKDEKHKPSNDWLVTPQIWIRGENAILSWRSKSFCDQEDLTSGYKIYISTTGNTPKDFNNIPIYYLNDESGTQWNTHNVSLKEYAGKRIYIAFVNDNLDKEILGIDDIKIEGKKGLCEFEVKNKPYEYGKDAVSIECKVTAYSDEPVTDIKAYYSYLGDTHQKQISGIHLHKNESLDFTFDETIPIVCGDTVKYEVWAEINGNTYERKSYQTISFLFNPQRRTVIEEGTGMWCGYCPKGIVAMEVLEKKYPNDFIGIAIHYDDPMEIKDYRIAMNFPQFPSGWINRKYMSVEPMTLVKEDGISRYTTLNGGFETEFLKAQSEETLADMTLSTENLVNKIKATVSTRFAIDRNNVNYQIAFVIVENDVTDKGYYQTNYFSGKNVEIGGYEKLPQRIFPASFQHVARAVFDDYRGIPGSVPTNISAGEIYDFEYIFDLPKLVKNSKNLEIIALLVDCASGEILNAINTSLLTTGINNVSKFIPAVTYQLKNNEILLRVNNIESQPAKISIYGIDGTLLESQSINHMEMSMEYKFALPQHHGSYFLVVTQGKTSHVSKFIR